MSSDLPTSRKRDGDELYAENLQRLTNEVNAGLQKFSNEASNHDPLGCYDFPHEQCSYVFFGARSLACSVVETLLKDDATKYHSTGQLHGLEYSGSRYRSSGELRVVVDLKAWKAFEPADLKRYAPLKARRKVNDKTVKLEEKNNGCRLRMPV
jgi:hypothetical protein